MELQYNPLENNFTTYTPVENPEIKYESPLLESPIDISPWSSGFTNRGVPIVKDNTNSISPTINNTPMQEILYRSNQSTTDYSNEIDHSNNSTTNNNFSKLNGNPKKAMEFFVGKGLSRHHAAGIVSNLMMESGTKLSPNAKNPTSGAYGIAQWLGSRKTKLFNKYGKNPTFDQQLEFIWEELNTDEKSAFNKLLSTSSIEDATRSFMKHFERPSALEQKQSINTRLKYARSLG